MLAKPVLTLTDQVFSKRLARTRYRAHNLGIKQTYSVRPNFVLVLVFWYFLSILMFRAKIRPAEVLEITKNQIFWPENLGKSIFFGVLVKIFVSVAH